MAAAWTQHQETTGTCANLFILISIHQRHSLAWAEEFLTPLPLPEKEFPRSHPTGWTIMIVKLIIAVVALIPTPAAFIINNKM